MPTRDGALKNWFTLLERGHDRRTGATAEVSESGTGRWIWRVFHASGAARGESTTRKGARAAARKHVRTLSTKPKRQLDLF